MLFLKPINETNSHFSFFFKPIYIGFRTRPLIMYQGPIPEIYKAH